MIYFVIPVEEVDDLMMEEAVESDKDRLHTSLDSTLAILSVLGVPTYAFSMCRRYDYEDILLLLATPEWDELDDEE